ncbi:hypothetical protein [Neiella litorisoli]|uniref:hypothetical protein n=1 Tax=Neiella litorisoli TaxID=2771431 RepID=UPI001747B37D|nr:hypothetical protein [Neiella litorisoli]
MKPTSDFQAKVSNLMTGKLWIANKCKDCRRSNFLTRSLREMFEMMREKGLNV